MNENRTYKKVGGKFRDAKLLLIICEGQREAEYFTHLASIHQRSNLTVSVIPPENNVSAPHHLIAQAAQKYDELGFSSQDYVYFVIDTDRPKDLATLYELVKDETCPNWHTAFSSPCFETWLLYHIEPNIKQLPMPSDETKSPCKILKNQVDAISRAKQISDGYKLEIFCDLADQAMINAKNAYTNYSVPIPNYLETQVFDLADLIINRNKDFQPLF